MCMAPSGKNVREVAEAKVARAAVLFEAKVLAVELKQGGTVVPDDALSFTTTGSQIAVRMQLIRRYRGPFPDEVTVTMGGTNCDFDFDTGETYLVDAQQLKSGGLFTSICSATSRISDAGPELRVLRNEPPSSQDLLTTDAYYEQIRQKNYGKICGRVSRSDSTQLTSSLVTVWKVHDDFRGAFKVDLALPEKRRQTFCSSALPPGKYFIGAEDGEFWETNTQYRGYYPTARRFNDAKPLTVEAGKTLHKADLSLYPETLYYVRGRVRDSDGRFLGDGELQVTIVSAEKDLLYDPLSKWIEEDGFFVFAYVPKGKYLVLAKGIRQEINVSGNVSDLVLQLK
jgi:hypothetical protein